MDANLHAGHRQRMRDKAEISGMAFLPEHEQLEIILFNAIPRGNTNEIAHNLLKKFHSIYGVLTADVKELQTVDGVGLRVAEYLHTLPSVAGIVERSKMAYENNGDTVLQSVESLTRFCRSLFLDTVAENLYAIFLTKTFRLIKFEHMSSGSMDGVYFSTNAVLRSAVLCGAYYIVLTHNHPSAKPYPSGEDRPSTKAFEKAANAIQIHLLDHIIIAGEKYFSFREEDNKLLKK